MNLFIQLVLLLFLTTIIPGKSMMRCLQPLALDRFLISRTWIQRTEEKQSVSRPWFNCLWREEILRGDSYSFLSFCICSSPSTVPPLVIIHFYRLFKNKMHFIFKFPVNGDMNTLWRVDIIIIIQPATPPVACPFHSICIVNGGAGWHYLFDTIDLMSRVAQVNCFSPLFVLGGCEDWGLDIYHCRMDGKWWLSKQKAI